MNFYRWLTRLASKIGSKMYDKAITDRKISALLTQRLDFERSRELEKKARNKGLW